MSPTSLAAQRAKPDDDTRTARRFTESASRDGAFMTASQCLTWLDAHREQWSYSVERVPLQELDGWYFAMDTGNLVHRSGRFFTIEGLRVNLVPGAQHRAGTSRSSCSARSASWASWSRSSTGSCTA